MMEPPYGQQKNYGIDVRQVIEGDLNQTLKSKKNSGNGLQIILHEISSSGISIKSYRKPPSPRSNRKVS